VVTVAIPYLFSACAQLTYLVSGRRRVQGWLLTRDLSISGAAVLFSLWVTFAAGYSAVYQAMVVVLAGIILYAFLKARRERLGQVAAPVDNAPEVGPDGAVVLGSGGAGATSGGRADSSGPGTRSGTGAGRDENEEAGR
jgi:APA family basic amino acid/polyamine antiporter